MALALTIERLDFVYPRVGIANVIIDIHYQLKLRVQRAFIASMVCLTYAKEARSTYIINQPYTFNCSQRVEDSQNL